MPPSAFGGQRRGRTFLVHHRRGQAHRWEAELTISDFFPILFAARLDRRTGLDRALKPTRRLLSDRRPYRRGSDKRRQ